ncbi:MAG: hypothetical protein AB7E70_20325 [Hyphomicrobiaceae bacterium]
MILLAAISIVGAVAGVLLLLDERWMNAHNARLEHDDMFAEIDAHLKHTNEVNR